MSEPINPPANLVLLSKCANATEAYLLKEMLRAAEITAYVADANFLQNYNFLINVQGGVSVMVAEPDLAEALIVLKTYSEGQFALDEEGEPIAPPAYAHQVRPFFSPEQAVFFSLVLSPVFGGFIHYLNSRRCPAYPRVWQVRFWLFLNLLVYGYAWSQATFFDVEWTLAFRINALLLVTNVIWYLFEGREQSRWFLQHYGKSYQRQSVWQAAAIALVLQILMSLVWTSIMA